MNEQLTIMVADGEFQAYVARPPVPAVAAVVVLQEVFGVNDDMRLTCNELAAKGFIAVCPDLYWRLEPGVNLNNWSGADWEKGLSLYAKYDRDQGVRDIAAIVRVAARMNSASKKVGVLGYCLGGLMTFLMAAREKVDAAVAYHGGETDQYLQEADRISAPLMMHLGDKDEFISTEAQSKIKSALANKSNVVIHNYPGCKHAFARHNGAHYDAAAAAKANGRTSQFFAEQLR